MTLELLYFAWLRERVGCSQEKVSPPAEVATVADLLAWLRRRGPGYEAGFSAARLVRCAVNQDFAEPDTILHDGDEVAFFPPVTGG
jgi:molybdopterin synthase sulfur carrier subunit